MSARSRCPPGLLKDLCTVFLSSSPGGVLALVTEKGSRVTAGTHRLPFGKASLREPNPTGVILRVFFSSCLRIAVAGTSVRDSGTAAHPLLEVSVGGWEPLALPEPRAGGCVGPSSGIGVAACHP